MQNLPIFSQMLVLMLEASQGVWVPKFFVILELQALKSQFQQRKLKAKLESPEPPEILKPKLMEKLPTLMQAIEVKLVDLA